MTPQNATLDSKRTLSLFVSYRRLPAKFQFSLSADTLGYLSQWFCKTSLTYHRVTYRDIYVSGTQDRELPSNNHRKGKIERRPLRNVEH
jgi:hypothetical protein